jgi:hypothetical protein
MRTRQPVTEDSPYWDIAAARLDDDSVWCTEPNSPGTCTLRPGHTGVHIQHKYFATAGFPLEENRPQFYWVRED